MDVLESIYVAHRLFQVCNLTQLQLERKSCSLKRCRPLECYSACVLLISLCLLFHSFFVEEDYMKQYDNDTSSKVYFMQLVSMRVTHIFSVLETLGRRNEQQKFYEKVREIDRIFESSLNVSVDNRSFRRKILKHAIIMLTIYISTELLIYGSIILSDLAQETSIYWTLYQVPYVICSLRYFQIFKDISIIKQRLEKLIATLEKVKLNKNSATISNLSPPTIKLIQPRVVIFETTEERYRPFDMDNLKLQKLLIIRDLYNRLWELTTILNRCVNISVLINLVNDFFLITSNFYFMFLQFEKYSGTYFDFLQTFGGGIWTISYLCNVLVLAMLCDQTVQSTTYLASGLHRIEINSINDNHNTVIQQFSLQLLHQKITFTAAGFFNIDCTLLYTIIGATTIYMVILIQFHLSEKDTNP